MSGRPRVLVVEDHPPTRWALHALLDPACDVIEAPDAASALALALECSPDLVLMDLHLPDRPGVEVIQEIVSRFGRRVLALTASADAQECVDALRSGACGVILKLGRPEAVIEAVRASLEGKVVVDPSVAPTLLGTFRQVEQARETGEARAFVHALDVRCPHTAGHSDRLSRTTELLATQLGLEPAATEPLKLGAFLHDVGKVGVPDSILWKPGPLDDDEWAVLRTHPLIGARMLADADVPLSSKLIVRHHHERFDGSGYPDGLHGKAIPFGARIVAVADAYDAMRAVRPYRCAMSREIAVARLREGRGTQFDPEIVGAFEKLDVPEPPPSDETPLWRSLVQGSAALSLKRGVA